MRVRGGVTTKAWRAALAVVGALGVALLGGCSSRQNQPEFIYGVPTILSVTVQVVDGVPARVNAVVRGYVSDACTEIDLIRQSLNGNTFSLKLSTRRPLGQLCASDPKPFEAPIPLVVRGLQPGGYTVEVGGKSASFFYEREGSAPQL